MDPAGGPAHVQRLAGVLLQVHPLDADPHGLVRYRDVQVSVGAQRFVVLGDLEVLRHVRVKVVLPGEPAPGRDRAVQGQPDPDRVLDRHPVHHRQRAGQAQADRADLAVWFGPEDGRAAAEHLGPGAQLHVGLQADHRLVALHRLGIRDQRFCVCCHESRLRGALRRRLPSSLVPCSPLASGALTRCCLPSSLVPRSSVQAAPRPSGSLGSSVQAAPRPFGSIMIRAPSPG